MTKNVTALATSRCGLAVAALFVGLAALPAHSQAAVPQPVGIAVSIQLNSSTVVAGLDYDLEPLIAHHYP